MSASTFLGAPPLAFAHQGGGKEHTENSWEAFEAAVALGYRYLETDVQASSDGVSFCMHDPDLDRTTNGSGPAVSRSWPEIAQLRVHGSDRPPPRLDEVLARWPELRVNIEPKTNAAAGPLIVAVRDAGAVHRVCVASFSGRRARRVAASLGPGVCRSAGPVTIGRLVFGSVLPLVLGRVVARTSADCFELPVRKWAIPVTTRRSLRLAHALGRHAHVWTVDDRPEMERLLDLGVDGIMTDRPTVLRDLLVDRGHWPS